VNRPDSLKAMLAGPAGMPNVLMESRQPEIQGVGVLRHPNDLSPVDLENVRHMARMIRSGSILMLPNTRDERGAYAWGFHIEGGDSGQVKVERQGE